MDGIALAARFSIATNRLSYCGPAEAEPTLYRAIVTGHGDPSARRALEGFEALWPYLEAIGRRHGLDPLDARVVEAYWIGNDLLEDFGPQAFRELLGGLRRRGLPASIVRRLEENLPAAPLPHHMFHVAFVGVGAVTGHVPTTLANLEACRPAEARVVERGEKELRVVRRSLQVEGERLRWGPDRSEALAYDARVLPTADRGRSVVVHWGWPALVLTDVQREALNDFTERSLAAANEVLPRLDAWGPGPRG